MRDDEDDELGPPDLFSELSGVLLWVASILLTAFLVARITGGI